MSEVDDFLEHHGILGMKWGHRKSRPIGPGRQARLNAASARLEKRANTAQREIERLQPSANRQGFMSSYSRMSAKSRIKDLQKIKSQAIKDAEAKKQGKLTSTEKNLIIGGAIVGAVVLASKAHLHIESGEATRLISKGMSIIKGEAFSFAKNASLAEKNLTANEIKERVVKHVNPDFGKYGTTNNCRRATFAYEMRRRGYDVRATKTAGGEGQSATGLFNAVSPNHKIVNTSTAHLRRVVTGETVKPYSSKLSKLTTTAPGGGENEIKMGLGSSIPIFKSLANEPNGSRGEVVVSWKGGGAHSMAYELINGEPHIIDAQSGQMFASAEEFAKTMPSIKRAGFTRLDNKSLNHDYLMRWVTNA